MTGTPQWRTDTMAEGTGRELPRDRLRGLCLALGLEPTSVQRIEATTTTVTAWVYVADGDGRSPIIGPRNGELDLDALPKTIRELLSREEHAELNGALREIADTYRRAYASAMHEVMLVQAVEYQVVDR